MNLYETTKLFWGEYLYKLAVRNEMAPIFRGKNLSNARQVLDNLQLNYEAGLPLERVSWNRIHHITEHAFIIIRSYELYASLLLMPYIRDGHETTFRTFERFGLHFRRL